MGLPVQLKDRFLTNQDTSCLTFISLKKKQQQKKTISTERFKLRKFPSSSICDNLHTRNEFSEIKLRL